MSNGKTGVYSVGSSETARPFSAQIDCRWLANARISSVGASHVCTPYSAQISCMWNAKTRILLVEESHVSGLSSQTGSKSSANTRTSWVGASHVSSPYSAQLRSMSFRLIRLFVTCRKPCIQTNSSPIGCRLSATTRILSLGASHVSSLYSAQIGRYSYNCTRISSVGASHVCIPHSAHIGCLSSANKWILSLRTSRVSSHCSEQIGWSLSIKTRSIKLAQVKFGIPYQHNYALCRAANKFITWLKSYMETIFSTDRL